MFSDCFRRNVIMDEEVYRVVIHQKCEDQFMQNYKDGIIEENIKTFENQL